MVFLPESSCLFLVDGKYSISGFLNSITRLIFRTVISLSERPSLKSRDLSDKWEELRVSKEAGDKCSTTDFSLGLEELTVVCSSMFSEFCISFLRIV